MGHVKQNSKVIKSFTFENTGNRDLKIIEVVSSCGCSIPKWPSEVIAPKEKDEIQVIYNPSVNKDFGYEKKTFEINTNGNPSLKLIYLEGTIE